MFSNRKSQTPGAVGDPSHILKADIHQLLMYSSSNSSVTRAQSWIPHSLKHKYKPFFLSPQNIYSWDIKTIKFIHAVYKTGSYVKCMQLYLWLKMNICFSHQHWFFACSPFFVFQFYWFALRLICNSQQPDINTFIKRTKLFLICNLVTAFSTSLNIQLVVNQLSQLLMHSFLSL